MLATTMTQDLQIWSQRELSFGPFRLYPVQRVLLCGDTPLRLGSRAREILVALVERAGEIVAKTELIARVWPNTCVEEGTLRVHIAALRKALGDDRTGMRYIENVTGHGYRFIAPVTRLDATQPSPTVQAHDNRPFSLTRTIGRASVVATLTNRLPHGRFVTIVGPGGIGKTTVATATADHLHASYPHGVRFVDLASIVDPQLVSGTVACALGLATVSQDPLSKVIELLRHRHMLLVLDSCEHVVEAAAVLVEQLLSGAPNVHVIATSREPLRAKSEWVLRLPPLELPPPTLALTADRALAFSAVQLFAERATASLDTFELKDADVPIVADICRRLDGLPLAIELAAARIDLFGIRGLAARLDDRFGLLTRGRRTAVPRHQTLRATLDWSYELLSNLEQTVLRRLAVFAGTFDMPSATAVAVGDEINSADVLDILTNIAAKSLLVVHAAGEQVLYRLLGTSRAYALEKLEGSHEGAAIKRRHAQLCCTWGEPDLDWEPKRLQAWAAENGQRIDDVRAALDWCCAPEGDAALGVRLTAASAPIWFQSSFLGEYRGRLELALQTLRITPTSDPALELHLNAALGDAILHTTGSSPGLTAAFNRTLQLAERLGTTVHHRRALWGLWFGRIGASDYHSAVGFAEAFRLFIDGSGDSHAAVTSDRMMALAYHFSGDQVIARRHAERALRQPSKAIAASSDRAFQFEHRVAARAVLARILWIQGFPDQARRTARESLQCAQSSGHSLSLCSALSSICSVEMWTGNEAEARRLVGMLLEHSTRHSLLFWRFWGRCLEFALTARGARTRFRHPLLSDPSCSPMHQETLGTFNEGLLTDRAIARAENGLAGWCAAELLRVKAEGLLTGPGAKNAVAETILQQSLEIAREQGALSWELRTATSLARLWNAQGRTREARELMAVHGRFTEGFETADLRKAKALLDSMSVNRRAPRRDVVAPYFDAKALTLSR
jgi:predicted ATPase/DNA-binding winged helix-turn-helix (wHTH) protein